MENDEFNCSICLEKINDMNYVFDDIFKCIHSHNVCSCCIEKIDICPLCRADKKDINYSNYSLEEKHKFLIEIIESEDENSR